MGPKKRNKKGNEISEAPMVCLSGIYSNQRREGAANELSAYLYFTHMMHESFASCALCVGYFFILYSTLLLYLLECIHFWTRNCNKLNTIFIKWHFWLCLHSHIGSHLLICGCRRFHSHLHKCLKSSHSLLSLPLQKFVKFDATAAAISLHFITFLSFWTSHNRL